MAPGSTSGRRRGWHRISIERGPAPAPAAPVAAFVLSGEYVVRMTYKGVRAEAGHLDAAHDHCGTQAARRRFLLLSKVVSSSALANEISDRLSSHCH
jgi:hypothetical protein